MELAKKYFIIVDMQKDFVTGSLKNDKAKSIIPAIVEKAKELKAKGYKIVATLDTHFKDYLETQEGKNLPVTHCIKGEPGWEIVDELQPLVDKFVEKISFGNPHWESFMEDDRIGNGKPEAIEMCGTVTEICVASNFATLKATYPEAVITVHKDLCAGLSDEGHNAAITVMKAQQAVIV